MTREVRPTPCLRCESDLPLTAIPRNELYFYTAGLSLSGSGLMTDTEQHPRGRLCEGCTRTFVEWLKVREAPTELPPLRLPLREVIPLHAHADDARVLFSVSPTRSTCPTDMHVREPDGTPWRVSTVTVDGVSRVFGELPYPVCPGNRWIDLEVVCPHDHPPTKGASVELRGVVVCEPSDLPVATADTERDQRWADDFRKPRGVQKLPNGEWDTTFRGDSSTLSSTLDTDSKE
jgi:hypothetical protein